MFRRTLSEPPPPDTSPAAPLARRFTDALSPCDTVFAAGAHVHGTLAGSGSVEVAGSFQGPIEIDGLLHVLEGGKVQGLVRAGAAVIQGELQGRLIVRGRVELTATSHVRADIDAATVAIAEGCMFDGRVHMGGADAQPLAAPTVTFREKRHRKGARGDRGEHPAAASAPAGVAAPAEAVAAPPAATIAAPPAEVAVTPPVDVAEKPAAELALAPAESVAAEAIPPAPDLPPKPPAAT